MSDPEPTMMPERDDLTHYMEACARLRTELRAESAAREQAVRERDEAVKALKEIAKYAAANRHQTFWDGARCAEEARSALARIQESRP